MNGRELEIIGIFCNEIFFLKFYDFNGFYIIVVFFLLNIVSNAQDGRALINFWSSITFFLLGNSDIVNLTE